MKKEKTVFGMLGMVMLGCWAISAVAAQSNFSGTWVLDKQKTHGLPHSLKSYTMVVTQNPQELVVETKVDSGLQGPESKETVENANPHATGRGGGGYLNSITTTSGFSPGSLALVSAAK